jgi:hypothetical protein
MLPPLIIMLEAILRFNLSFIANAELTCNRGRRGRENAQHFPHSAGKAAAPAQQGLSGRMICSRRQARANRETQGQFRIRAASAART